MENKINIAELLKDCPKGMELNCTMYENVEFDYVEQNSELPYPIHCLIKINGGYNTLVFTRNGCNDRHPNSKCVIFPKGKTTWEGFQRPFKDGDIVYTRYDNKDGYIFIFESITENTHVNSYLHLKGDDLRIIKTWLTDCDDKYLRIATEEEKQKLFDAIKANGYKWNEKTKTLEKIIVPKFKVGDRVQNKNTNMIGTINLIINDEHEYQVALKNGGITYILFEFQDNWELVPNKFDITTLKPFDKVLVRCNSLEKWHIQFFEKYNTELGAKYPFICLCNSKYCQCIPYEGNEHLLGTTDYCNDFYKTW